MFRISTLLTILLFGIIGASAATLTVTTTADSGLGTLRQAIDDAILNGTANDIDFAIPTSDPGYNLATNRFTITLSSSLPTIPVSATTIINAQTQGITVTGNNTFGIFNLVNSAVVTITNLTISNGRAQEGGAIFANPSGTLTLNDCVLENNFAVSVGGAVYVGNGGTLHVNGTSFRSNSAFWGGAIYLGPSSTVNMNRSTVSGNSAGQYGGGIFADSSGTLNSTNSTFSANSAVDYGGAIFAQGTFTLNSNTITGNSAVNQHGGGIFNNSGVAGTLNNNLIALNTGAGGSPDLGGSPYTATYNLVGQSDGSSGITVATNMWGTTATPLDPKIGPLQNNGGTTETHALMFDSPALDQGNAPGLLIDQRGRTRPFDDAIIPNAGDGSDMGAYEFVLGPSAANVSINGRVVSGQGKGMVGIANAAVTVTAADGTSWDARTNSFGYFELTDIPSGVTYLISVSAKRYSFDTQTVSLSDDIQDLIITAN